MLAEELQDLNEPMRPGSQAVKILQWARKAVKHAGSFQSRKTGA